MKTYTIESEDSSQHWPHFNTINHVVLDLGCGRWRNPNREELSPIFFGKTAKKIIGVDSNINEIDFYKKELQNNDKFKFLHKTISSVDEVKCLIKEYSATALKVDIEGAEIVLLDLTKEDLETVSEFAIEFHNEYLKKTFFKKIPEWNFEINVVASFGKSMRPPNEFMGVYFCSKTN